MTRYYTTFDSPVQTLTLVSDGHSLTGLYMTDHRHAPPIGKDWVRDDDAAPFAEAKAQLNRYFKGQLQEFDLPIHVEGTPFQAQVWEELRRIPYGETITYGELARRVGSPTASRAVGAANGRNPVSIIVPCHRVIGAGGILTGYGGGLERKAALLALEAAKPSAVAK